VKGNSNKEPVSKEADSGRSTVQAPAISLPKGGGAIRGMGEKFAANPVTGTGSMSVPISVSPGRSGFAPQLALSYDSGSGNGPFGFGWSLSLPCITRKTEKGLPKYKDSEESDIFILSGAEDLVPALKRDALGILVRDPTGKALMDEIERDIDGITYRIRRYRPRVEGLFARIERWTNLADRADVHWRSITKDNVTTFYGRPHKNADGTIDPVHSRISDPADHSRIFTWMICQSHDDKGNAMRYEYVRENSDGINPGQSSESNRSAVQGQDDPRSANRYLKRICYGNATSLLANDQVISALGPDLSQMIWHFDVVFDYGDGHYRSLSQPVDDPQFATASVSAFSPWPVRADPFSTYRAGFEVRAYRLCRRVLMFHHFAIELGIPDYLVRSTEFTYRETPTASFIVSVTQSGFLRQQIQPEIYLKKSLPSVDFEYSEATIDPIVREVEPESLENLPSGLDGDVYRWVDLDSEGISGILTEQAGGWFYKRNLSPLPVDGNRPGENKARFAPVELVAARPSASLGSSQAQFIDLAGDGQMDLVTLDGPLRGFFERTGGPEPGWENFRSFNSFPNLDTRDPNLKFIDLDGDGLSDILISEEEIYRWHPSLGEAGYGPSECVGKSQDEESGPRLVFADGTQSIFVADMSGDGLADLVRIRNGEICYWPNLGYGKFGSKITMDNAPWFDEYDLFGYERVRLADIDGSGATDIIYLGGDGVRIFFNQSGNSWSPPHTLPGFRIDNLASVVTVDLLGNGTACLVWSSPLPGNAGRPMRYIDLMGGQKPNLLVKATNNLGAETLVTYAASTKFYLQDKFAGKPWITKLPFPVHVVESVETVDRISRTRFTARYAYHHGYFDGIEREFRGFGMVEQWNTSELASLTADGLLALPGGVAAFNLNPSSHVPPVLTRTWFHTGVNFGRNRVSDFFAGLQDDEDLGEYYREPGLTDAAARELLLDDTVLPDGLTTGEERDAFRALKGSMLRREVYALDGTGTEDYPFGHPYIVSEQNFTVHRLQPKEENRYAVFFTHARESINYHYERNPSDPRVTHSLTLEVDRFGNVLKEATVGHGRRQSDPELSVADQSKQIQIFITYTENTVTNAVEADDNYRTPMPRESRTYELTNLTLAPGRNRFSLSDLVGAGMDAAPIDYENSPTPGLLQKRLIEHSRTLYRRNNLTGALPPGEIESLALPFESYKLALTEGLVTAAYNGQATPAMMEEGRYVHSVGDASWWITSGQIFYSPGGADTSAQEQLFARENFFLPHRYRDPFHTQAISTESVVAYDSYKLLLAETRDPLGNRNTAGERDLTGNLTANGNDYRVLQPRLMMDPNRNRTGVAFDALGMVVATAVMGKPLPAPVEGDRLSGFETDLTQAVILDHIANPLAAPGAVLGRATTRLIYDMFAYQRTKNQPSPEASVVYTLARETHDSAPVPAGGLRVQHSFSYSDGFGREIQKKIQAEAGPVPSRDANGEIIVGPDGLPQMTANDVSPRWVGSGWTVFNNKGKPVRQYEPFFTDTNNFEFDIRIGVSPVLFYDPVERVVATLHPDHTWEKVVFNPWRRVTWDRNDTVLIADPKTDLDVGDFFRRLPPSEYLPGWHTQRQGAALGLQQEVAARKAAIHAETPSVAHLDSLGRAFLTVGHNKFKHSNTLPADPPIEELNSTRLVLDIEGNQRGVRDAMVQNGDQQGRIVMLYEYDMLGNRIHQSSMEAGERWMLNDIAGKPLYAWDSRQHRFHSEYDQLRRPTLSFLREGGAGPEILVGRTVYGETRPNPETNNLRGQAIQVFDQAGVGTSDEYDFKGNLLHSQRQLAQLYNTTLNWAGAVQLEAEIYNSWTRYDALNRPTEFTTPDDSVIRHAFNEANLLERVEANLRGAQQDGELVWTPFVTDIDYNAKGQRTLIDYGNGVRTTYEYDPLSFRLIRQITRRNAAAFPNDCPQPPVVGWQGCQVQNLHYVHDPVGNIIHIRDDAQQTVYFMNKRVEPSSDYTYDALYRLIEATGREHLGQVGGSPIPHSYNDAPRCGLAHPADGNAMGTYLERYLYDRGGNILGMLHRGSDPAHPGWARDYSHEEPSLLEPAKRNNRLTRTAIGATSEIYSAGANGYDAHGNMLRMPHLQIMHWDFKDQLQATTRQAVDALDAEGLQVQGDRTWYVYGAAGERVRKVTESAPGQIKHERIYLSGFEIYRAHGLNPQRCETLHLMDDKQRIALVETRTQGLEPGVPARIIRYQFDNHLGSTSLELNEQAEIISYEEYTPFGCAAFLMMFATIPSRTKRYRYTGKERDEESKLYYHGARYYAPWLGRWTATDPAGIEAGLNLFEYCYNNPIKFFDDKGRTPTSDQTRFRNIFTERRAADSSSAHAQTLVQAFRDTQISGGTARERFVSILGLTGSSTPGPDRHFDTFTIREIGTRSGPAGSGVGDTGFRRELRDSVQYRPGPQNSDVPLHRASSDQIGHFLTAAHFGFSLTDRENYVRSQQQEAAQYRAQHPYLSIVRDALSSSTNVELQYAFENEQYRRALIGHELIADNSFSGAGITGTLAAPFLASSQDVQNFLNGRLDLISINDSQAGNSYQDLLLTWVGYRFGQNMANGAFASKDEAARWLEIMLTDQNLIAVQPGDPFYADAMQMQGMLQQFRAIQERIHPAAQAQPAR